jgi:ABC-type multidrug transport system fused ATPase/permease subunit
MSVPKEKKKAYEKIHTYFMENLPLVLFLCIGGFLFNSLMCLVPVMQGQAINELTEGVPFETLRRTLLRFLGLVLLVQFNRFLKRYLGRLFQSKMIKTMRSVSYSHMLKMNPAYFTAQSHGDILNKILLDIDDFSLGISRMTMETFDTFVLLIGYLGTLFFMDARLTWIVLLFLFLSVVSIGWFRKRILKTTRSYKEYLSETKDTTLYSIKNQMYYRGLGVAEGYLHIYEKQQKKLEQLAVKSMALKSVMEPLYHMIGWLGLFFILWMGGGRVMEGSLPVGTFSAYLTTYLLVARKASRIGRVYGWYQNMRISGERCRPFLVDREACRRPFPDAGDEEPGNHGKDGFLVAKQFSFGFDGSFSTPKLSFTFFKGERIGICGRVHTGKSSLLAGISGLYGYEGSLLLENKEMKDYACPMGYCPADVLLFEDTWKENVCLGREGDWEAALSDAMLLEDLAHLEKGAHQKLSRSMHNISGGQEKRLGLARALFGKPKLILLDDPFQSIDRDTSKKILERLKAYENSLILMVTNQSCFLKEMTKVLFLKESGFCLGTYEELLQDPEFQAFVKEGEA